MTFLNVAKIHSMMWMLESDKEVVEWVAHPPTNGRVDAALNMALGSWLWSRDETVVWHH